MDDEMLERCTRAAWDNAPYFLSKEQAKVISVSVIKAMREPTERMWHAGIAAMNTESDLEIIYHAMIDAILND